MLVLLATLVAAKEGAAQCQGGRGAPLEEAEVEHVQAAEKAAAKYLPELNRRVIEIEGSVEGRKGIELPSALTTGIAFLFTTIPMELPSVPLSVLGPKGKVSLENR